MGLNFQKRIGKWYIDCGIKSHVSILFRQYDINEVNTV